MINQENILDNTILIIIIFILLIIITRIYKNNN